MSNNNDYINRNTNSLIKNIDIETNNMSLYSYIYSYFYPYQYDTSNIISDKINDTKIKPYYIKYFEDEYKKYKINKLIKQISLSPSFDRFREKYLKVEEFKYYFERIDDIENNYDITKLENLNNIINFSKDEFLNAIKETYPNDTDIVKQFTLDFPRQKIYVNDILQTNVNQFFLEISKYNRPVFLLDSNSSIMIIVLLLLCQSSFYMSFMHIYNKILKMKENIINNTSIDINSSNIFIDDVRMNYHLLDHKVFNEIYLKISENHLSVVLCATYRIVNIVTEEIINSIKSETIFDINTNKCLIIYETI